MDYHISKPMNSSSKPEDNNTVKKADPNQLADMLREILCNHQLPFKDRVREITTNPEMYDYILNILEELVI